MIKRMVIACIVAAACSRAAGQSISSSNLPIVIINTDGGVSIPDDYRVLANMKIIYHGPGERNYVTDQNTPAYLNYNGRIDIEVRGSSSSVTNKKQYGFSTLNADNVTNNNVNLLGMPAENDWILNGMVWDTARIRDYLCFNLSRQLGEYASRTVYCEVIINGSYRGLYLLDEKIKADDNRVDVIKINPDDISPPALTGGYITKADKTTGGDPVAWTMTSWYGGTVNYIHHMPKPEEITTVQHNYIRNWFFSLANAAQAGNTSLLNGYPAMIDIPSFIHYIIISELASNADSYGLSTYFHKDRNGKLRAGPVWDSDLTFGNDLFLWGYDRSHTNVWQFHDYGNDGSRFWYDLYVNSQFRCYLSKRWNEVTSPGQLLNPASIGTLIDQTVSWISEAIARDYAKWGISNNHNQRISDLKAWLAERVAWITSSLGSYAACSNVEVPPLVITKIMYNPVPSVWFPDGEELEFIEITNTGSSEINLSGIYFGGTGLVYQFPYNSTIVPDTSYYLAASSSDFVSKYGFQPSGEYTRHLSNSGQDIVLLDAFGNIIDRVNYSDTLPWPEADGNGYYLRLKDAGLDNNDASNWIAVNDILLSGETVNQAGSVVIYPNPVQDILKIRSEKIIVSVELTDAAGRSVGLYKVRDNEYGINVTSLKAGVYFIRIITEGETLTNKFIRY